MVNYKSFLVEIMFVVAFEKVMPVSPSTAKKKVRLINWQCHQVIIHQFLLITMFFLFYFFYLVISSSHTLAVPTTCKDDIVCGLPM